MCPFRENCEFYNQSKAKGLSANEQALMKEVFCDSQLFMLNKDCKIFHSLSHNASLKVSAGSEFCA